MGALSLRCGNATGFAGSLPLGGGLGRGTWQPKTVLTSDTLSPALSPGEREPNRACTDRR